MAKNNMSLNSFSFWMDKNIIHIQTSSGDSDYSLCALYVRNWATVEKDLTSSKVRERNGNTYYIKLHVNFYEAKIEMVSDKDPKNWHISLATHSGNVPLENRKYSLYMCDDLRSSAYITGEDFKKLHNNPCAFIFRKKSRKEGKPSSTNISSSISAINSEYLKSLHADLKDYSSTSLNEKVTLRVNAETETANKAILCARSPVLAKMFECGNDKGEPKKNSATITDIKMPVLKAMVSFLCSGLIPDCHFEFLCNLYSAANVYEIAELHQECIRLMLTKTTFGNILCVLKLAFSHKDEFLKSAVMTLVSANIETVASTSEWIKLMCDDPDMVLKASTFFEF